MRTTLKALLYFLVYFNIFFACQVMAKDHTGSSKGESSFGTVDSAVLKQWKDLKYSMFIHWGIYSELGGVWEGREISKGLSEQIQAHAGIYSDSYANVAKTFNPVHWNADSIAKLAKAAGMGSIVITSKHHDGFAMYDSRHTDFDVVDATPFKRDVIKELSDACKRHGLKFGLYFSLIDWHYPQASPISSHNSDPITPEHHEFNKKQITELLSNYGTISELWFDMGSQTIEQSREMRELVHRLQPGCMIGSRIGNDMGDFMVMGDNQEPDYIIGVPWQSPASFFHETWGYRSWQKRTEIIDKTREKLTSLIRVVSRGGNYLLNIGPRGDGTVVEYERDVLLAIGDWLNKNGEAIYKTERDPFQVSFDWGSITSTKNKLFLHVISVPSSRKIFLPGLNGKINKASVLGEDASFQTKQTPGGIEIDLPLNYDLTSSIKVIALAFENGYKVSPHHPIIIDKNQVELRSTNAFKYFSNSGIDYNTRFQSTIMESWVIYAQKNKSVNPQLFYTEQEKGKSLDIGFDGRMQTVQLNNDLKQKLNNNPALLSWGPLYLQGPVFSGLDGIHGGLENIDPTMQWTGTKKVWSRKDDWKNSITYSLPGEMNTAYYVFQEIQSPVDQPFLIKVASGDGVMIILNGKELFKHNNPSRSDSMINHVILDLKKGKNQLVVKLFNHFNKEIKFSIDNKAPQDQYVKQLNVIDLGKKQFMPLFWKLHSPQTPHENLAMPNLRLNLK